ncbi:16554_t:CDS:2, partial [Cetraspora pellucida]
KKRSSKSEKSQEDMPACVSNPSPKLSIEFEVGRSLVLRPNQVVRGAIILKVSETDKTLWASTIKIKFRGDETATSNIESCTARTTYFECSSTVWSGNIGVGGGDGDNEYCPWKELTPGVYRFEFALKLPAINFPPSIEGPKGFSIRYVWQAVIEGAGGTFIEGPEVVTPLIPIYFAPPAQEWTYKETLRNENKVLMHVEAILPKHVFAPGEEFNLTLNITNLSAGRITYTQCSLRKHYEGPLDKDIICDKHERSLASTEGRCDIPVMQRSQTGKIEFSLTIPKKHHHVPPSYTGRHLRVYYTLRCVIQVESGKFITNMQFYEITIPISVTSFPHSKGLVNSFPPYSESRARPYFFDPKQDFPPDHPESIKFSYLISQFDKFCDGFDLDPHYYYYSDGTSSLNRDSIIENTRITTT